jgi:hypothetical protein
MEPELVTVQSICFGRPNARWLVKVPGHLLGFSFLTVQEAIDYAEKVCEQEQVLEEVQQAGKADKAG